MKSNNNIPNVPMDIFLPLLLLNSSDVIIIISKENTVIEFNAQAEIYFSLKKAELKGHDFSFLDKKIQENQAHPTKKTLEWNSVNLINAENEFFGCVVIGKNTTPPSFDNQNAILDSNLAQLTQEKEQLEKENIVLKEIISSVPGSIYWKNKEGVYLGCNDFLLKLVGLNSKDEIIGKSDSQLWPNQAATLLDNDQQVIQHNDAVQIEEQVDLPDGTKKYFTVQKTPLYDADKTIIGIIGNSIEITELKQTQINLQIAKEAAEAATQAEEEMRKTVMVLVGNIVHDLRTPIATIRIITSVLSTVMPKLLEIVDDAILFGSPKLSLLSKKEFNSIKNNTLLNSLHGSVEMMNDFINTTLTELTNAQKAQHIDLAATDLTKCSSQRILINTLDVYPLPKGIIVHQSIDYDFYLMGNSILIMKILFNLIRNSIEQIELTGYGEITISTENAGNMNLIKVRDTAGGAPNEVVSHFFNEFFTTKKNGTGIGLESVHLTVSPR